MATSSKRDVVLGVGIETTGEAGLQRLAEQVRRLGAEGGPAAAQFDALADQIDRLAGQAGQVDNLRRLTTEVDQLAARQTEAAAASQKANDALQEQARVVVEARTEQQRLVDAVNAAKTGLREAGDAVRVLRDSTDSAGRKTAEYANAMQAARAAVRDKAAALDQARTALSQHNSAVAATVNEETKLAAAANRAAEALAAAARETGRREGALQATQAALVAAGSATTDLAQAEAELLQRQQALVSEAEAAARAHRDSVAAMQALEAAAREADRQYALLAASLNETQQAAQRYADATDQVVASSERDTNSIRERVAAAQTLLASEQRLSQTQRDMANSMDAGRAALLAEAQALVSSAQAADAAAAATARLVREARSAESAISTAFGQTGVRSLAAIEAEALATERAVSLLERQFRAGAITALDLERAVGAASVKLERLRVEASQVQSLPNAFERANTTITGVINRFGALSAAIGTVAIAARPAIEAMVELERTTRVLTTITGSARSAGEQVEYLRGVAQRSGQSFDSLAGSYSKFAASALQSGLTLSQTQEVFNSVAGAAGNLGLSSDQAKRALEALAQMASKGTIGMEELRQQLGDALPGVLPLLAKELGITQRELVKLVEAGGLLANEGIPAIGRALKALGAQNGESVTGMVAEWNRFKSVLSETATLIGSGAIGQALGAVATGAAAAAKGLLFVGAAASEGLTGLIRSAAGAAGALVGGGGLKGALEAIKTESTAGVDRLTALAERMFRTEDAAQATAKGADVAGESLAKLRLRQGEAQTAAEDNARVLEKLAQAHKTAGGEAESLGKIMVDKAEGARIAARAQAEYADAVERQAVADRRVADEYTRSKQELLDRIASRKEETSAYKDMLAELDKNIAAKTAEAEKTSAAARAEREKAEAMALTVRTLQDNAREYEALRVEVDKAQKKLADVTKQVKEGRAPASALTDATKALAEAKFKLKDASDDVAKALEREINLMKAQDALARAQANLELQRLKTQQAEASFRGRTFDAAVLGTQIKEVEIGLENKLAGSKRQQAEATLRAIAADREAAIATGTLTDAKEAEFRARELNARAALVEAQADNEGIGARKVELEQLQTSIGIRNGAAVGIGSTTRALDKDTDAIDNNTEALRRNADAISARSSGTAGGTGGGGGGGSVGGTGGGGGGTSSSGGFYNPFKTFANAQYTPPDNSGRWVFNAAEFNRVQGQSPYILSDAEAKRFWMPTPEAAAAQNVQSTQETAAWQQLNRGGSAAGMSAFGNVLGAQVAAQGGSQAEVDKALAGMFSGQGLTQALTQLAGAVNTRMADVNVIVDLGNGRVASVPTSQTGAENLARLLKYLEDAMKQTGGGGG